MAREDDNTHTHRVLTSGTLVQHYRIIEKIGAGGMGEVYLAEDTKLQRRVALKFLPASLVADHQVRTRFVREAQTLAQLNHPNIVSIYEVSELGGRPFYAMELVEGQSLHHYCHEEPLPFDLIIEYAIQICQGLGEAHRAGIVHRDIKSANMAVDKNGRICLLDFGLAAREGDDKITRTGSTLGTVAYMSPEQVSGREIDHRSDLFSLGIVLYELIAGRTPFRRDSEGATLKAIMEDAPEPLTRYKSNVPDKLEAIVMELLEKDKEIRYQTAEGVIADLKRLMYDSQPTGQHRTVRPTKRKTWLPVGIAAALVVVSGIIWMLAGTSGFFASDNDSPPMIAVLPFNNLGSTEDEYFAEGMTDEIQSRLAGISGLGVISPTSAMKFKGSDKSVKQIGEELDVDYVVEGTVRWSKIGDNPTVRITPRLVRTSDERQLWSDNYQRDLVEVFSIQADIASRIVDELDVTLIEKDRDKLQGRPTKNPRAYALYLKAESLVRKWSGKDDSLGLEMTTAIDSAIALDPGFALAYALRSQIYLLREGFGKDTASTRMARESAERSLQLQPGLPEGHIALGNYYNIAQENYDLALEEFNKARSKLHNNADLLAATGLVQGRMGQFQEAIENLRRAARLDPLVSGRHRYLANLLWFTRSFEEADRAFDRAIALEPSAAEVWIRKVQLLRSWTGDWDVIVSTAREALQHCDSITFLARAFFLKDHLPDIDWEEVRHRFWVRYSANALPRDVRPWSEPSLYLLAKMSYTVGDSAQGKPFADSARLQMKARLQQAPRDFHTTSLLGGIYALLGECDEAVHYGRKGVNLMPVEKCHM